MPFPAQNLISGNDLLGGVAYLSVDGVRYRLVGEFSYSISNIVRETKAGMDGVHGYTEKPQAGMIKAKLRDAGNLSVADFRDMTDVTVTCELANGKIVTGIDMWTTEAITVETEEGTFDVTWNGKCIEGPVLG